MKRKVRVTVEREVPIYRYKLNEFGDLVKTDQVLKLEKRVKVLFSGSKEAFKIWKQGHALPASAKEELTFVKNTSNSIEKFSPTYSFGQDSVFMGRL